MSNHELYNITDFTDDEIKRRNCLAIAVIEEGCLICKLCGKEGQEILDNPECERKKQ